MPAKSLPLILDALCNDMTIRVIKGAAGLLSPVNERGEQVQ